EQSEHVANGFGRGGETLAVRDPLRRLDGEAKVLGRSLSPGVERLRRRHSIESGMDLDRVDARRVIREEATLGKIGRARDTFPRFVAESRGSDLNGHARDASRTNQLWTIFSSFRTARGTLGRASSIGRIGSPRSSILAGTDSIDHRVGESVAPTSSHSIGV